MSSLIFYLVDVFAVQNYGGNQLARAEVFLVAKGQFV
jgi:predicted PhzF superfamily epimerase YddE/YHI9